MNDRKPGITLIELVVACALLSLLLLAAGSVSVQARQAATSSEQTAYRGQLVELTAEFLRYHVGMAGHQGTGATRTDLAGPPLAVAIGEGSSESDLLAVRYLEDRWRSEPVLRAFRFEARKDGSGNWNLYRQEPGSYRQPAVQEVTSIELLAYLAADGRSYPASTPLPLKAVALEVEVGFAWGAKRTLLLPLGEELRIAEAQR